MAVHRWDGGGASGAAAVEQSPALVPSSCRPRTVWRKQRRLARLRVAGGGQRLGALAPGPQIPQPNGGVGRGGGKHLKGGQQAGSGLWGLPGLAHKGLREEESVNRRPPEARRRRWQKL